MERKPRVAVFDCDGTLWSPDSGAGFMEWSLANGLVAKPKADWLRERYRAYHAGAVDEATICGEMVQVYAGLREAAVREAAACFVAEHALPFIFPEMERLVSQLASAGAELWAVSSTCDWVIEAALADRFPIPPQRILAARVHVEEGAVTDRLFPVPTDEAKAAALRKAGVPHPDAAFGNSVHDLAMLEIARFPYAVHPTAALEEYAGRAGWRVVRPLGSVRQATHRSGFGPEADPGRAF